MAIRKHQGPGTLRGISMCLHVRASWTQYYRKEEVRGCTRLLSFTSRDHEISLGFPNLGNVAMRDGLDREVVIING